MGRHESTAIDDVRALSDPAIPGLTWRVSVTPDTDTIPEGALANGKAWNVVVIPVVDGHDYGEAAHGQSVLIPNKWLDARMVRFAIDPGIVPDLTEQAREALPAALMAHARNAIAIADAISGADQPWDDDQDIEPGEEVRDSREIAREIAARTLSRYDGPPAGIKARYDEIFAACDRSDPDDGGFFEAVLR